MLKPLASASSINLTSLEGIDPEHTLDLVFLEVSQDLPRELGLVADVCEIMLHTLEGIKDLMKLAEVIGNVAC